MSNKVPRHPKHMDGNTAQQWMWYRRHKDPNWIMKGIVYITTDSEGKYKDYEIKRAFELHVQNNQLIVLRHPNCLKNEPLFLKKLRKELEEIYRNLKERY